MVQRVIAKMEFDWEKYPEEDVDGYGLLFRLPFEQWILVLLRRMNVMVKKTFNEFLNLPPEKGFTM